MNLTGSTHSNRAGDGLICIFDGNLIFAGPARIEKCGGNEVVVKTDYRCRAIDVHALRHKGRETR